MKLEVLRFSDNGESTIGALLIDGVFECYTIEDEQRTQKVFGETRIPEGTYPVKFRNEGGHHNRYKVRYDQPHGMLHVINVPNFKYILIHIGNTDDDTAGCLLVGNLPNNNKVSSGFVGQSTEAYIKMYSKVAEKLIAGEEVTITYKNMEGTSNKC